MRSFICLGAFLAGLAVWAQGPEKPAEVLVSDYGAKKSLAGPGAPVHIIGLERHSHEIALDTGRKLYSLHYVVALDKNRPGVAIVGEGYIGMPRPAAANWYHGGFFDCQINGQSLGTTPVNEFSGQSAGQRGYVDFIFDAPQAVARIRFMAVAGEEVLYAQALIEPKEEIRSLRVILRCYPSAFVTDGERHVLTPRRDLVQGQRADLDITQEDWLLFYDRIYDAGYVTPTHTGAGPCAVLWLPRQALKVSFAVGSYGTDTVMDLQPQQRDFRFIFMDFAGTKNAVARQDWQTRADAWRQKLANFNFTDPRLLAWPLQAKQAELQQLLERLPPETQKAAQYERWSAELAAALQILQAGGPGAIKAEAQAAKIISAWEQGLLELKLQALLNEI